MDYYRHYCDKYQSQLNTIGYEIVALDWQQTDGPSIKNTPKLVIRDLNCAKSYRLEATDIIINNFVKDMQRRETTVENAVAKRANTIQLCIEDYCQTCPHFKEDVEHESLWGNGQQLTGRIYIRCEHRKICERIATMMKEKKENSEVEKRHNT